MQIVSCQYFSRGGRIREGLPKKTVQTQVLLLVTSNMLTLLKSKTTAKVKSLRSFKKRKRSIKMVTIKYGQWIP